MELLSVITTGLNLVALAASLWLGLYLVTRSRKSTTAWLAAGTLWVLAAYFFQGALAANDPNNNPFGWMRALIVFIVAFWIHITFLLLPAPLRANWMRWGIIPLGYILAILIAASGIFTNYLFTAQRDNPLFTSTRGSGPAYYLILPLLVLGFGISLWNLWRARKAQPNENLRGQFDVLLAATVIESLAGALVAFGTAFSVRIPFVLPDALYFAGVFLFGYVVARYNATLEGRPIERDFVYTLLVVGSLTLFYCLVVLVLYLTGQVSFLSLALTVVGTVLANSLFDRLRVTLDRLFYQRQFQRLRSNLRGLAREAGTGQTLPERLQAILNATVRFMRIKRAFIAIRRGQEFVVQAAQDGVVLEQTFPHPTLEANEIVGLVLPARKNLQGMKLLVPLFADGAQTGALVLGERENATAYGDADLELLEDLGDQIAQVIHKVAAQEQNAQRLNELVEDFRERERALQLQVQAMVSEHPVLPDAAGGAEWDEEKLTPLVEDALRHISDYPYLGEQELARLCVVERAAREHGSAAPATFVERGKAVSQVVLAMLEELKPGGAPPKANQIAPREWHLYLVLHDSYVLEEPNREVMSKLYISEGTFNRTRRRALRALAKALAEFEASASL